MSGSLSSAEIDLLLVRGRIERTLNMIAALFRPGAKLTLVVRQPCVKGDAGLVLTNDTFPEVIAELERRHLAAGGGDI